MKADSEPKLNRFLVLTGHLENSRNPDDRTEVLDLEPKNVSVSKYSYWVMQPKILY